MMLVFQMKTSNLHHSAKLVAAVVDRIVDPQSSAPFCIIPLLWPHHGQNVVPRPWFREWQCASSQPKPWEDSLVDLFLLSALVFLTPPLEHPLGLVQEGWDACEQVIQTPGTCSKKQSRSSCCDLKQNLRAALSTHQANRKSHRDMWQTINVGLVTGFWE